MSPEQILNKAMGVLTEVSKITSQLTSLERMTEAHAILWSNAVENGDGKKEHEERQLLHSYLDQSLDLRQKSLQLVKELNSLPPPNL